MGPGAKKATDTTRFVIRAAIVLLPLSVGMLVTAMLGVRANVHDMELVFMGSSLMLLIALIALLTTIPELKEDLRKRWLRISKKRWRRQHPRPGRA